DPTAGDAPPARRAADARSGAARRRRPAGPASVARARAARPAGSAARPGGCSVGIVGRRPGRRPGPRPTPRTAAPTPDAPRGRAGRVRFPDHSQQYPFILHGRGKSLVSQDLVVQLRETRLGARGLGFGHALLAAVLAFRL